LGREGEVFFATVVEIPGYLEEKEEIRGKKKFHRETTLNKGFERKEALLKKKKRDVSVYNGGGSVPIHLQRLGGKKGTSFEGEGGDERSPSYYSETS